jgi:23S rRNA (adenine-N6)-dimethyltransferase
VAGRRGRSAPAPARAPSQHFLRSPSLAAELVREAGVGAADLVLDLGAGTGRLTAELARRARRVLAVELDPRLAARLDRRWDNVEVIAGDAVDIALPDEPFQVVANVPFARTTDLLRLLLDDPATPLVRADLVVEWEVARKRGAVWPSSVLNATWGAWYSIAVTRRLPPEAFAPRPSVAAGVLRIERRAQPLVPMEDAARYRAFVRHGFARGTRTHGRPPRDLDVYEWAAAFRAFAPRQKVI